MKVTSNAYNFSEYISSGVDPRTGTFSMQINMGNFLSYKGSGLTIPLVISHDGFNYSDSGFGRGWSFPLSQFNKSESVLKLSSGQSFKIKWSNEKQEYELLYRKLKDIRVFYLKGTNEIKISYKSGRNEYLEYEAGICTKIVSPQGLEIHLAYSKLHGKNTLWQIKDNQSRVVEFDWWTDKFKSVVTHSLGGVVKQKFEFIKKGSDLELAYFHISEVDEFTEFEYAYFRGINYKPIKQLTHSSGLIEKIDYNKKQYLPVDAPFVFFPCVSRHVIIPGENQQLQQIDYSFSNKNYLGFASDRRWDPRGDTIFNARRDYTYSSTEIINSEKKTIRTYNKYHLVISEKLYEKNKIYKEIKYEYFADITHSIEFQPAQYSLLKKQITTSYFAGQQRDITLEYQYDEYANQIKETLADGSSIDRVFYPLEGEQGLCPKNPNGMVSMLKSESFIPQDSSVAPRNTTFKYVALVFIHSHDLFLVLAEKTEHNGVKDRYSYYVDADENLLGRIKQEITIINGNESEVSYNYNFSNKEKFILTRTTTSHDKFMLTTIVESEPFFMNEIKIIGSEGEVSTTVYDVRGRVVETSMFPDTEYSNVNTIQYCIGKDINYIIETDSNGNKTKKEFNNAGKIIRISINTKNDTGFKKTTEMFYNSFGELIREVDVDILSYSEKIECTTRFEYDNDGDVKKIYHPDSRIEEIIQNTVALTSTHIQVGLLKVISSFNVSGELVKKETINDDGQTLVKSTHSYDSFGNQIQATDTIGHNTDTAYDDFDRVKSVTRYIDGQAIQETFEYPNFTASEIVSVVKLDDIVMGTRDYDGLLRVVKEVSVDIPTIYTYDGISSRPLTITKPRNYSEFNIITFVYEPVLKKVIARTTVPSENIDATFKYDKKTGLIMETLNPFAKTTYLYDSYNRLTEETVNLNNGDNKTATFVYSLKGKVVEENDFFGGVKFISYDEFGRVHSIYDVRKEFSNQLYFLYDTLSRPYIYLSSFRPYAKATVQREVRIEFAFNSIGVETNREVVIDSEVSFSISQEYNSNMQLKKRDIFFSKDTTTEQFLYDDLNRIVTYNCDGIMCPSDEKGNAITAQTFKHDNYGNVIEVINTLKGQAEKNTRQFTYKPNNPVLLGRVTNTHPDYLADFECKYDFMGNLANDEDGNNYAFNVLGQVDTVFSNSTGTDFLTSYDYDANGQMVGQKDKEKNFTYFYYNSGNLLHEMNGDAIVTYINQGPGFEVRYVKNGNENQWQFLLGNGQGSIVETVTMNSLAGPMTKVRKNYMIYGESGEVIPSEV